MIILTGFQPFLLDNINSSWEVVKSLPEGDDSFLCCELPVEYEVCFQKLKYFVESQTDKVDYIFLFGQATERTAISIERVALNWNESRHSDESGVLKLGEFIIPGAPNCYLQNWNFLNTELENIKELQISYSAGAYVCNDLYYRALHHWPQLRNRIVFLHTPKIKSSEQGLGMELQKQVKASREFINLFRKIVS